MKYIIFLGDGMADRPIESLNKKTPLMVAQTPNMDALVKKARCGTLLTIPEGMPKGSAVANLTVMGYDPKECYEGRGVLEAANQGVDIAEDEVGLRCNIICVKDGKIKNHSGGHISNEEAAPLVKEINEKLGNDKIKFHQGVSYRHLLVLKGTEFSKNIKCTPPHDVPGTEMNKVMVTGDNHTSEVLNNLILRSNEILENHQINLERENNGKDKANYIWPWSPGKKPKMEKFIDKYGKNGAVISAVDLINGIGVYAGFDVIRVEGATGLYDTNYEGKADAVIESLKNHDFVYCHVEASDEASHEADIDLKIKTIEYLDKRLIGRVLENLNQIDDQVTMAILPDHFTPCSIKTHSGEPVPFMIINPEKEPDNVQEFNEESCKQGSLGNIEGDTFIKIFLS